MLTDLVEYFERAVLLGHYNKRAKQQVRQTSNLHRFTTTGFGLKLRAHPLAVAIANVQLNDFFKRRAVKHEHALRLRDSLREYKFIRMPDITGALPSWYSFIFNFDEKVAGISIDAFYKAVRAEGLMEADRPTSTNCLCAYPLFTETHLALPRLYDTPMLLNPSDSTGKAVAFVASAVKIPVWGFEDEIEWVDLYAGGLTKVCDAVMAYPERFK